MPEITTDEGILRILSAQVNDLEIGDLVEQLSISIPDNALGLSAPQIGIHKRAFLANLSSGSYVFINPTISWTSTDRVASVEACLSLPGVTRCIERASAVSVSCDRMIDVKDGSVEVEPEPVRVTQQDAFIIQHETDHLDGILIIDHPEVPNPEQGCLDRAKKRKERIIQNRLEKANKKPPPPKPQKMSAKRLAKKKRIDKKLKKQQRTAKKQEKIRVEIQERYRAEQEGLLEDQTMSAESAETTKNAEL